ncbi:MULTISPECIES: Uma2 family endonuclease [Cyanophyceae]|uniref:Uma2 family endonuclease n=1 Tax=Cyanophyceae TaxID=3028117 RepID=UPI0016848A97|nr:MULTISPECIES: Uma2 family endonuclease [Cyanophyceae]MBD1916260.1 Uma2 family endonuclease [Phormidium sp. FACHB-77]MBD2031471.1 Uma2 family endonuclease [Phormidium sp. FACHB-322]MBD2052902.1 Uma2 family endonuclease [Leptolyngbya sp. FACHB-60]
MVLTKSLTLEQFLQRPETKPASEFFQGEVVQKPMPQGEHSTLQGELCDRINQIAKSQQIAYAFPELRCVFGGNAIVPDVTVFRWGRIPRQPSGRVANRFELHPDWAIEILSPEQSQTKVLEKLLYCSEHGTEIGWLIDPEVDSILTVAAGQRVQILNGDRLLPILSEIPLSLTAEQVFGWLSL